MEQLDPAGQVLGCPELPGGTCPAVRSRRQQRALGSVSGLLLFNLQMLSAQEMWKAGSSEKATGWAEMFRPAGVRLLPPAKNWDRERWGLCWGEPKLGATGHQLMCDSSDELWRCGNRHHSSSGVVLWFGYFFSIFYRLTALQDDDSLYLLIQCYYIKCLVTPSRFVWFPKCI